MPINLSDYEAGEAFAGDYRASLGALQERLSHLFVANLVHKHKAVVVCEGWDASGKGGAIQRLTSKADPRAFKVWPIAAPSDDEKAHHYLWRFWRRLPAAGEVAIFDRSWYGRVLVERVERLASETEWRRAFDEINEFEAQLTADGTVLIKLFFHVTQPTQDARLRARLIHPWKAWKVTAQDFRNIGRRSDYVGAVKDMLDLTDTRWAPWKAIDGNDKKSARVAALTQVADALARSLPSEPPEPGREVQKLAQAFLQGQGQSG
jgi:polyphosphate kinase 2 (PPK2 family)